MIYPMAALPLLFNLAAYIWPPKGILRGNRGKGMICTSSNYIPEIGSSWIGEEIPQLANMTAGYHKQSDI